MSLIQQVAAVIEELGEGDADDVLPLVSGATRAQVIQALQNAKYTGLLVSDGARPPVKGSKAARLTAYRPAPPKAQLRVSSVFALGAAMLAANDRREQRAA